MATIKISELPQLNTASPTDVLPIVHAGETLKVEYQTLFQPYNPGQVPVLSSNWNSVYSSVRSNSSNWNSVYNSVSGVSGSWNSVYSSVRSNSASWGSVYNSVRANSANWNSVYSSVASTSSNWNDVYDVVAQNNAKWESVYSSVLSASGSWDSVYNSVQPNSASWNSVYSNVQSNSANYALTNQNVSFLQNVTIFGGLTALSGATFTNTIFTTTSALSVINTGGGPALFVYQAVGPYDVASFYDGDGVEVLHVGNAAGGGNPRGKVGINESDPSKELTVKGAISASEEIIALGGNSNQWNSVYSNFQTNSSKYETVYASMSPNSAKYESVYSSMSPNSGKYESVYSSVLSASGSWDSVYSSVRTFSGEWGGPYVASTFSTLTSNSATWVSTYTTVSTFSASWGGAFIGPIYTTVNQNSARWNSNYTTTNTLSTGWAYRSGDIITEVFDISVFAAGGYTTSTAGLGERAFFIGDWGNVTKWKKSGCTGPTITFYVVGRTSNSLSVAEFDLYNLTTGLRTNNSYVSTNSVTNWQLLSSTIAQADMPTAPTVMALRSGRVGSTGNVELAAGAIHLTWTVG